MKIKLLLGFIAAVSASSAFAAEHTVAMKNVGADGGIMVFEPAVLRVNVGDTVHFEPTDPAHNSESVPGLTPAGSVTWKGTMNEKISVTLDKEGVYVYQCTPHLPLAMVGVIVAGEPTNMEQIRANADSLTKKFGMNQDRLEQYLSGL